MKIAIKGHLKRGKEVIQILESLGGKSTFTTYGFNEHYCYYVNSNSRIIESLITTKTRGEFNLYTLEEFETQFPFKIGDKVITPDHKSYKIIALENYNNKICYKLDNGFHYVPQVLKPYKEIKEERNITLALDKAKEWYKKGGDLKHVALQAFTEEELTKIDLPKTWEEFCTNYLIQSGEAIIDEQTSEIHIYKGSVARCLPFDKNVCPSKESAEAHLAMIQLEQLRDCWRQGWEPTKHDTGYQIIHYPEEYSIRVFSFISFLSFPTKETAEKFLECFGDLIEKAGDLI